MHTGFFFFSFLFFFGFGFGFWRLVFCVLCFVFCVLCLCLCSLCRWGFLSRTWNDMAIAGLYACLYGPTLTRPWLHVAGWFPTGASTRPSVLVTPTFHLIYWMESGKFCGYQPVIQWALQDSLHVNGFSLPMLGDGKNSAGPPSVGLRPFIVWWRPQRSMRIKGPTKKPSTPQGPTSIGQFVRPLVKWPQG